jgi:cation transport regulator
MPYASIDDLPASLRSHLPHHAQEIFRSAFNAAWENYATADAQQREETAYRVAWSAVKRRYRKVGEVWVAIDRGA